MDRKKMIDINESEFTGIVGREKMDLLAEVVGEERWKEYRDRYACASGMNETAYPVQIDFELNGSCNLKCPMCPMSEGSSGGRLMEFETYKGIIDEGVEKGLRALNLAYINEPLIRRDLPMFVKYARDKGICDVYFSSNGLLLNDDNIRGLIEAGLTRIQISIDAFTEETYNTIRIGGNYNNVLSNIDNLLKIRREMDSLTPLVRVNFVKTNLNEHELDDFIDYWKDRVDMIGVQEMINFREDSKEIYSEKTADKERNFKCSVPFKEIVVRSDGTVLACCAFLGENMPIGNIYESKIEDIWKSDYLIKLQQLHKEGRYYDNPFCKQCVEGFKK